MALCGALFFRCAVRAQRLFLADKKLTLALPWLTTMSIFVSWPAWEHASRAEVYAFEFLTSLGAPVALCKWLDTRQQGDLLLSCFLIGLGFSNHHWMTLCFALPGAMLIAGSRSLRPRLKDALLAVGFFLLGLLPLAYLPIRSLSHPLVNFGAPHTLERFWWTYTGSAFTKSIHAEETSGWIWSGSNALNACVGGTGIVLALVFLASLFWLKQSSRLWVALALIGSAMLTVLGRSLLGFDLSTPDHHAYLLPAIAIVALISTVYLATFFEEKKPGPKVIILGILAASCCVRLASNFNAVNKQHAWSSVRIAEWEFSKVLPGSTVLLSYFQTTFRWWALSSVYGHRPDITVFDRSFMTYPGFAEESVYRNPTVKKLVDAPVKAGVKTPLKILREMSTPIYIQYHPNLDRDAILASTPAGPFAALFAPKTVAPMLQRLDSGASLELMSIKSESKPSENRHVFDAMLWHDVTRINALCLKGETPWAKAIYSALPTPASEDPELELIAERCGIK